MAEQNGIGKKNKNYILILFFTLIKTVITHYFFVLWSEVPGAF